MTQIILLQLNIFEGNCPRQYRRERRIYLVRRRERPCRGGENMCGELAHTLLRRFRLYHKQRHLHLPCHRKRPCRAGENMCAKILPALFRRPRQSRKKQRIRLACLRTRLRRVSENLRDKPALRRYIPWGFFFWNCGSGNLWWVVQFSFFGFENWTTHTNNRPVFQIRFL